MPILHQYAAVSAPVVPVGGETVSLDRWHPPIERPVWDVVRWQHAYPAFWWDTNRNDFVEVGPNGPVRLMPKLSSAPRELVAVDPAPRPMPALNPAPQYMPALDPSPRLMPALDPAPQVMPALDPAPRQILPNN